LRVTNGSAWKKKGVRAINGADAIEALKRAPGTEIVSASAPTGRRWFAEISSPAGLLPCVETLRGKAGARLMAITCVDEPAFRELLYHYSLGSDVLTLRTMLWKPDTVVASITPSDPAAELMEHEITELFGVAFEGNPRGANMILPDGDAGTRSPLSRQQGSIEVRIDRNLASIVSTGATTQSSKRVAKVRVGLGMAENPPVCGLACPGSCATQDISDASGASSRHPGIRKKKGDGR
jgi:NADH:ubiquinone oxidoreductase subunit C